MSCLRLTFIESLEVRRLLAAGDLDATFGGGGRALLDHFSDTADYLDAVAISGGSKLVLGGSSDTGAEIRPTLARYHLDGTPDATFGQNGKLRLTTGSGFADLAVNAGDTITTLSKSTTDGVPLMRRFTASGALDTSFNYTLAGLTGTPSDLAPTAAGGFYLVVGNNVGRVHANGSPDAAFGQSGRVTIPQEANTVQFRPQRAVAMADGGVVLAGQYGSIGAGAVPVTI